ncbi:MAG: radical SAM family heme chaperone HemW [Pseudobdellovibrionaceae bacterium]
MEQVRPLAIYIHWPFCLSKCPYCDFNSHVAATIDHAAWRAAYLKELDYFAALTNDRIVTSIFFGGGTPSLMPVETVAAILQHIGNLWVLDKDIEITLEANPTSVENAKFKGFAAAGINRVSIGVQSLNEEDLRFLGRQHSAQDALEAVKIARETFPRYSFDLIYARPRQTLEAWEDELGEAIPHMGDHASLYQLTIEPQTPFYAQHKRGEFVIPDEEEAATFYETTRTIMGRAGFEDYEVSNYARGGEGARSKHNLTYWRTGEHLGIGPGAHGRVFRGQTRYATRMHRAPDIWLQKTMQDGVGLQDDIALDDTEVAEEKILMGMRLSEGLPAEIFAASKIDQLIAAGDIERLGNSHVTATLQGRLRLNSLITWLLEA